MEITFKKRGAFKVAGLLYKGRNENQEIARMWNEQFFEEIKKIKNIVEPDHYYGVCDKYDFDTKEFEYIAGVQVGCLCGLPSGMVSKMIPEQHYAVFKTKLSNIMETYEYIYNVWAEEGQYTILNAPSFEYYDKDFCRQEELYLYIPIKK